MHEKSSILSSDLTTFSSQQKTDANPIPSSGDRGSPLPKGYGKTSIVLLPRDPNWMFTYWEITEETVKEIQSNYGEDIFMNAQATLRMHEVNVNREDYQSIRFVDVGVFLDAKSWYLRADKESSSWFVELGLKMVNGRFISIAKSNRVNLPGRKVSDMVDEKWVTVKTDLEKVMEASGGGKMGMGSLELARMLSQRWGIVSQISSWRGSGGISSFGGGSWIQQEKGRKFWLVADCELVLYGATEPSATVTVAGKPIELNPDGTFSLRFLLPDGQLELPVKALAGDQLEEREIKITVERKTETG